MNTGAGQNEVLLAGLIRLNKGDYVRLTLINGNLVTASTTRD